MDIKDRLLNTKCFIDNEYLDAYCELILSNKNTPPQVYITQTHHIIPGFIFKMKSEPIDDTSSNKVHLLFKDHVKAHYLLSMCGNDFHICNKNYLAIKCLVDTIDIKFQENIDANTFDELQVIYETIKHTGPLDNSTKDRISKSLKGRISITKDGYYKYIYPCELEEFIAAGWTVGHNKLDAVARQKVSKAQRGRVRLHKDSNIVAVKPDEVDRYIDNGYVLGEPSRGPAHNKDKIAVRKDNKVTYIIKEDLQQYTDIGYEIGGKTGMVGPLKGKKFSDEHKARIGQSHKGRVHLHKGDHIVFVHKEAVQSYLDAGYTLGSGIASVGARGKVWVTNIDGITKYIAEDLLLQYLAEGWQRGRTYKKGSGLPVC